MKILFVSTVPGVEGGAEQSLLELAGALRRRDHQVSLAVWSRGDLADAFSSLGDVFVLGAGNPASPLGGATTRLSALRPAVRLLNRLRLRLRPTGRESRWLASVMAEVGPDVVHTNCDLSPPAVARAARASGVPWVAHVRDYWRAWFEPRTAGALRSAGAVVATSCFLADRFREHGIEAVVIPNPVAGVELERTVSEEEWAMLRSELDPTADSPSGPFLVAVVGRLDEQKGTLRVVEAAARLARAGEDRIRFLLAGQGDEAFESRLRRAMADAGVGGRIRLLGYRPDVARWLPAVDALAVPSTGEPFGRMIVEGMLAGLPVVAFDDGAAPELLEDGRTGVLVPAGDVDALADSLRSLAEDGDRARRLGAAARSAAGRFAPDMVAGQVEELYHRLMED